MIDIDGSHGEGGGQLLRTAVALAAITGQPLRVRNVRARRSNPGLAAQHLAAVKAVAALCNAEAEGLHVKSQEIVMYPQGLRGGEFQFDVGTAGTVTLVLQAALPVALMCAERLVMTITGGTDIRASPPLDYFRYVFLPLLESMGARVSLQVLRRGYFPRGGGEVVVEVEPGPGLRPLVQQKRGSLSEVGGIVHTSNLPAHVAARMAQSAQQVLPPVPVPHIEQQLLAWPQAVGQGGAIVLWARCATGVLGAAATAQRGVPAERLGEEAGQALRAEIESGATLDVHAADQMLVYAALASDANAESGPSRFTARTLSSHARTTMWLIEQFLPVEFGASQVGELWRIDCRPRSK
ncbi:RNA 3'-terminal phosphate cyclase [Lacisediminimonas profundi]|uniref:RNA 3'-terminal phosphate cyclase n=1 Tax=Lacisediminimonas profundi TaxID=2603856 RepID=UPI00124AFC2D|nr:RNA 3'-terminal phosphate cyclase [Lacisediminimonas profundi]